jgi:hypothetical protein
MPASTTIRNTKRRKVTVSLLDADGQPFTSIPEGASLTHTAEDPAVCPVTPVEGDPFSYYAGSGQNGTTIVASVYTPAEEGAAPFKDALAVAVVNSEAASLGFQIGDEEDEVAA